MKKVKENTVIIDTDGDEVNVTGWIPLIVAGVNPPKKAGATNANVSFVVQDNKRHEAWIDNDFIKTNSVAAGFTMWVKSWYKIGDLITGWENEEGDIVNLETPKQRIAISKESDGSTAIVLQAPTAPGGQTGPLKKYKG